MIKKLDKQSVLYLIIVIVAAALVCLGVIYFISRTKIEEKPEEPEKETLVERQLRELDQLRGMDQPLSEEEIQEQLKELNELRGDTPPLSEEETQKQLEELEALR